MDPIPDGMMLTLILAIIFEAIMIPAAVITGIKESHRKKHKHNVNHKH